MEPDIEWRGLIQVNEVQVCSLEVAQLHPLSSQTMPLKGNGQKEQKQTKP